RPARSCAHAVGRCARATTTGASCAPTWEVIGAARAPYGAAGLLGGGRKPALRLEPCISRGGGKRADVRSLQGIGCLDGERCGAAIRRLVPEYGQGWRCKLVLEGGELGSERLNICYIAVQPPGGDVRKVRLPAREFREIVAATNFKQRVRKMLEYYHADRLHFAVLGTPNRLEYDQGFFVKGGDGLADVKPIAHLYKSQVYQLAEHLGVPPAVRSRPPTTDTYSLPQTQEEFFFSLPLTQLDLVLQAHNDGRSAAEAAIDLGMQREHVDRVYRH